MGRFSITPGRVSVLRIMAVDDPILSTLVIGGQKVPGIWRYLLPEDGLWLRLPAERTANCDPCFRAAIGECRDDCRCCTYFPQLPNYALGLALNDATARPVVRQLISAGHVLPQGLLPSPQMLLRAVESNAKDGFGRQRELICPFFGPTGKCGIHAFRNAICATYFCENDHGEVGETYWNTLRALVGQIETVLAQWAMDRMGLASSEVLARMDALSPEINTSSEGQAWSPVARKALWGDWFGREEAFLEGCADLVRQHRDELYQLACAQPPLEARVFDRAVIQWLPAEYRDAIPPVPDGEPVPTQDQWYRLQLKTRQLWELPFNGAPVVLRSGVTLVPNAHGTAAECFHEDRPWVLLDGESQARVFCSSAQAALIRVFSTPQVFGEALFEGAEIEALEDARGFLAQCLRRRLLVEVKDSG